PVGASEPPATPSGTPVPSMTLFEGIRAGALSVAAEGSGDGRMILSVKNKSPRAVRVVLPPGLVASGASGQFGGVRAGRGGGGGAGGGSAVARAERAGWEAAGGEGSGEGVSGEAVSGEAVSGEVEGPARYPPRWG